MYEFIRELISNPLWALCAFLASWQLLVLFMVTKTTIDPVIWARLEFVWIGIGFLGLLSLVGENRRMFQKNELEQVEKWIEGDFKSLIRFSERSGNCFKYINTGIFEQEEFERRQLHQDMICQWTNEVKTYLDSLVQQGFARIDKLPVIYIDSAKTEWTYTQIHYDVERLNVLIDQRNKLSESVKLNFWDGFRRTLGAILLIVAFALRFTMVTNKVRTEKKKQKDYPLNVDN
ncbi:MAG: hypothetical protein ABJG41_12075 [Cyclobacteriaceae bacterium]